MPDPKPKPQIEERTLKIFTPEQYDMLLAEYEAVRDFGYGEVTVVFDNHHPSKPKTMLYKMFPKPGTYKAE